VIAGLRQSVPGMGPDRYLAPEIDRAAGLVRSGEVLAWAESVTGPLQ
jgi:histidine ammonia-lyase